MKAFIDTSTLFKKYIEEKGTDKFESLLENIFEIIVSPITWLEMNTIIERRLRENTLNKKEASYINIEAKKDFNYFSKVIWNENLERKSIELIKKYPLKTLDSLQLASACLSNTDIFITSDKKLFNIAKKELKKAHFI